MPELPEVEITARNLRAWALGKRIDSAEAEELAQRIFRPRRPGTFAAALAVLRVTEVRRVGKQILVRLEDPSGGAKPLGLISHLGMTGKWLRRDGGEDAPSHSRARLHLDDGVTLHYRDPRLFGRLREPASRTSRKWRRSVPIRSTRASTLRASPPHSRAGRSR